MTIGAHEKSSVIYGVVLATIFFAAQAAAADSAPWEASPHNWKNSPHNYENSPYNFHNSPRNFQNAEGRRGRINIVNLLGVVTGYAIIKKDGGINYFNSDGTRIAYSVDGGTVKYDLNGDVVELEAEIQE